MKYLCNHIRISCNTSISLCQRRHKLWFIGYYAQINAIDCTNIIYSIPWPLRSQSDIENCFVKPWSSDLFTFLRIPGNQYTWYLWPSHLDLHCCSDIHDVYAWSIPNAISILRRFMWITCDSLFSRLESQISPQTGYFWNWFLVQKMSIYCMRDSLVFQKWL